MAQPRSSKEAVQVITNSSLFNKAAKAHVNKDIEIPSIEGKQKFQVYGKGIDRNTWVYIYPREVKKKREKYSLRGQWLFGPLPQTNNGNKQ